MKIRWLGLIFLLHGTAARSSASEVDEFLKSYREAYPRLLRQYDPCSASGVMTEEITHPGASSPTRRLVQALMYARSGEDEKFVVQPRESLVGGEDKSEMYPEGVVIRRGSRVYGVKGSTYGGDYSLAYRGRTDDPRGGI